MQPLSGGKWGRFAAYPLAIAIGIGILLSGACSSPQATQTPAPTEQRYECTAERKVAYPHTVREGETLQAYWRNEGMPGDSEAYVNLTRTLNPGKVGQNREINPGTELVLIDYDCNGRVGGE